MAAGPSDNAPGPVAFVADAIAPTIHPDVPPAVRHLLRTSPSTGDTLFAAWLAAGNGDTDAGVPGAGGDCADDHAATWRDLLADAFFTLLVDGHLLPASAREDHILVDSDENIRFLVGVPTTILPSSVYDELPSLLSALALGDKAAVAVSAARPNETAAIRKQAAAQFLAVLQPLGAADRAQWCTTLAALPMSQPTLAALFERLSELGALAPVAGQQDWFAAAISNGAATARIAALRDAIHPEHIAPSLISAMRLGRELPDALRSILDQLADGDLPFRIDWRLDPMIERRERNDSRMIVLAIVSIGLALLSTAAWLKNAGWSVLLPGVPLLAVYFCIAALWIRPR